MPTLKVVTWNVENLFRPAQAEEHAVWERYENKLALLARVLAHLDADVVALQEVGGLEPLSDLQRQSPLAAYAHAEASLFPDDRGIRVAVLSKHAILAREDIVDFPPGPALRISGLNSAGAVEPLVRMSRGALRVQVDVAGTPVHIITAHLKSKLLTFPRPHGGSAFVPNNEDERAQVAGIALLRRTAEAVTLRMRANALLEGNGNAPLLVLGDLNDVPEAQTSLVFAGPSGSELGTGGFARADAGDDVRLFNIAAAIASERRYSRVHRGRKELLDQILASEELFAVDAQQRRQPPLAADAFVDFAGQLASVTENPNERAADIAPDHAPVTASFTLN